MSIVDEVKEQAPLFRVWIGQNKTRFLVSVGLGVIADRLLLWFF